MKFLHSNIKKQIFRYFKKNLGEKRTRELQYLPFRLLNALKRPPFAKVGNCSYIPGHGFFINGWLIDGKRPVTAMAISFADHVVPVAIDMMRIPRLDIQSKYGLEQSARPGFIAYIQSSIQADVVPDRGRLLLTLSSGKKITRRIRIKHVNNKPLPAIQRVLGAIPGNIDDKRQCFDNAYGPAINAMWSMRERPESVGEKVEYNNSLARSKPEISLIIPIYGRFDFMEYQLCQFVNDPAMHRYEILYVIDDPRIAAQVRTASETYAKIFRIPFSVLYLKENLGFAGANNEGVAVARGENVLLLNSDVMPSAHGWLEKLLDGNRKSLDSNLIGARLLYEDDAIQHDGMAFYQSPFVDSLWTNIHPGKGMPSMLVDSETDTSSVSNATDVEAITGACILMRRRNYIKLGGLDENYILGDYEDSDLCMKAHEAGFGIKIDRQVVLYHLERQSQSLVSADNWKSELTYYNCWFHTQRWHEKILAMKAQKTSRAGYEEVA